MSPSLVAKNIQLKSPLSIFFGSPKGVPKGAFSVAVDGAKQKLQSSAAYQGPAERRIKIGAAMAAILETCLTRTRISPQHFTNKLL